MPCNFQFDYTALCSPEQIPQYTWRGAFVTSGIVGKKSDWYIVAAYQNPFNFTRFYLQFL